MNKNNLVEQSYGYWLVTAKSPKAGYYTCVCTKCSTVRDVLASSLTSGKSHSCGCVRKKGAKDKRIWDYLQERKGTNNSFI